MLLKTRVQQGSLSQTVIQHIGPWLPQFCWTGQWNNNFPFLSIYLELLWYHWQLSPLFLFFCFLFFKLTVFMRNLPHLWWDCQGDSRCCRVKSSFCSACNNFSWFACPKGISVQEYEQCSSWAPLCNDIFFYLSSASFSFPIWYLFLYRKSSLQHLLLLVFCLILFCVLIWYW